MTITGTDLSEEQEQEQFHKALNLLEAAKIPVNTLVARLIIILIKKQLLTETDIHFLVQKD